MLCFISTRDGANICIVDPVASSRHTAQALMDKAQGLTHLLYLDVVTIEAVTLYACGQVESQAWVRLVGLIIE